MPLLKTVKPEEATGVTKEAYSIFENMGAPVALPMQMMSISPFFVEAQGNGLKYYISHPSLKFPLLAHIRMLVAYNEGYEYCIALNEGMLKMLGGLSQEDVDAVKADPSKAKLDDKDKAMLLYVLKVTQDPAMSSAEDIAALKDMGWSEQDIFEAVQHGLGMITAGMAFKIFKMSE
ncbi:hypothetical protein SAMN02745216_04976 [Desulfatibacillum alkenivorans DSM 16219]|jgi:hypothetical protein|uniref:Alkylhydroperoxidase family enzyme, contains CxxC motif n=1 Tax=Desulfatibacillum alkenivorans DSM 16219 TaxID=1121393 RepID=A0A1M6ZI26_9BACT|nr:hypothetical protein [Desulfatibacillum alkenivorans]SHL29983.1 hypothetical protein SAMN02745216_04976 [Desulfatibacillum alkenivorans DSM 16219]